MAFPATVMIITFLEGETPTPDDDAHRALQFARGLLQEFGNQREEARITEIEGRDDGRARLHGGANKSLSARKLDHFLIGLVHVHSRDSVHHHVAAALDESLTQTLVRRLDGAHPANDGGVHWNDERALRRQRVE